MATTTITGYTDKVSVAPGGEITFHISVENAESAHVEIVRLIHGDEHPALGVRNPVGAGLAREPAEDLGVDHPQPG